MQCTITETIKMILIEVNKIHIRVCGVSTRIHDLSNKSIIVHLELDDTLQQVFTIGIIRYRRAKETIDLHAIYVNQPVNSVVN